MPPRKKITVDPDPRPEDGRKRLTEDTWVVLDLAVLNGSYYVTAEDEDVNVHDLWFAPEGTTSLDSTSIELLIEDSPLDSILTALAERVKSDLADLPTTKQAPKPPAPKAKAPAKKAAVKKPAAASKKATAPAKTVAKKAPTPPVKRVVKATNAATTSAAAIAKKGAAKKVARSTK